MGNMSYCRVQNTLDDLRDVYDNTDGYHMDRLSREESEAFERLVKLCGDIWEDFEGYSAHDPRKEDDGDED